MGRHPGRRATRLPAAPPTPCCQTHPVSRPSAPAALQVKWGADFLINSHVGEFEYMGSMGNNTEGERSLACLYLFVY